MEKLTESSGIEALRFLKLFFFFFQFALLVFSLIPFVSL